ncbi:MAG: hypothetical protein J6Q42_00705 [Clostridia bacterium]|nr:hypothetical protein [Clostridia bacterium]
MKVERKEHPIFGETLFLSHEKLVVGIPLHFGIRISYLSYDGSDNLFFEQPNDMVELSTPDGWRVRGGHRLWLAPESKDCYFPDNLDISYELTENGVILHQPTDPWLQITKSMTLSFLSENQVQVTGTVTYLGDGVCRCSPWGITSVAAGGVQHIPLPEITKSSAPVHTITSWYYTDLGDARAEFNKNSITLRHATGQSNFKIGVGHPAGPVTYTNKGVVFEKAYTLQPDMLYPDGGVSYETYMCNHMVELESLAPLYDLKSGDSAFHTEIWKLYKDE